MSKTFKASSHKATAQLKKQQDFFVGHKIITFSKQWFPWNQIMSSLDR